MILFGHFLTPQGARGGRGGETAETAVSFKAPHQTSGLRSQMMGPKQSTGSGSGRYTYESICIAVEMQPYSGALINRRHHHVGFHKAASEFQRPLGQSGSGR